MSAEGRANIAAARRRWAEKRAAEASARNAPAPKKGGMTAAGRKRLSEIMKARWASQVRMPDPALAAESPTVSHTIDMDTEFAPPRNPSLSIPPSDFEFADVETAALVDARIPANNI